MFHSAARFSHSPRPNGHLLAWRARSASAGSQRPLASEHDEHTSNQLLSCWPITKQKRVPFFWRQLEGLGPHEADRPKGPLAAAQVRLEVDAAVSRPWRPGDGAQPLEHHTCTRSVFTCCARLGADTNEFVRLTAMSPEPVSRGRSEPASAEPGCLSSVFLARSLTAPP